MLFGVDGFKLRGGEVFCLDCFGSLAICIFLYSPVACVLFLCLSIKKIIIKLKLKCIDLNIRLMNLISIIAKLIQIEIKIKI